MMGETDLEYQIYFNYMPRWFQLAECASSNNLLQARRSFHSLQSLEIYIELLLGMSQYIPK